MKKLKVTTVKQIAIQHISGDIERWQGKDADVIINYENGKDEPDSIVIYIRLKSNDDQTSEKD